MQLVTKYKTLFGNLHQKDDSHFRKITKKMAGSQSITLSGNPRISFSIRLSHDNGFLYITETKAYAALPVRFGRTAYSHVLSGFYRALYDKKNRKK